MVRLGRNLLASDGSYVHGLTDLLLIWDYVLKATSMDGQRAP